MEKRVLKKSHNRVIAGVCAGIAEYLGWQPRQVRAIFVLVALLGGTGIIAYLILWLAMPPADSIPPGKFNLEDFREQ
jgi:phage shock protein PspC (stress-responsive transcriptional regulator)